MEYKKGKWYQTDNFVFRVDGENEKGNVFGLRVKRMGYKLLIFDTEVNPNLTGQITLVPAEDESLRKILKDVFEVEKIKFEKHDRNWSLT